MAAETARQTSTSRPVHLPWLSTTHEAREPIRGNAADQGAARLDGVEILAGMGRPRDAGQAGKQNGAGERSAKHAWLPRRGRTLPRFCGHLSDP